MGQLWILLLIATLSLAESAAPGQSSEIDRISRQFPGYHVLLLNERDAETKAFILQHFPKSNPSVVHADFDGDGHSDYALLLKNNQSETTRLVVLLCSENQHCTSVFNQEVATDSGYAGIYVRPVRIGSRVSQSEAIETQHYPAPTKLRSVGIEVTYFEKAKVVYYWNKKRKKIEAIQTAD
jgi:hypothetical protein